MCIKYFFEVAKEYFDSIYSQGFYDDDDHDTAENGINENDNEVCYCTACSVYRVFSTNLNKYLDHNKGD